MRQCKLGAGETDLPAVLEWALNRSVLGSDSIHGPGHWKKVRFNGLKLAEDTSGADRLVIQLFALLHDCRRQKEGHDPEHGPRAAESAMKLQGGLIHLDDEQADLLKIACRDHTKGQISTDPTIGCCWDADRLDLVRVGISPKIGLLSTEAARFLAGEKQPWQISST